MKYFRYFFYSLLCLVLIACTPQVYQDYSHNVDSTQTDMDNKYTKPKINSSLGATILNAPDTSEFPWLKTKINIHARNMPLNQIADKILRGTPAANSFESDINQSRSLTLNFQGSRKAALDLVSAQTGYAYTVDNNIVNWSALITRTFDVSFMPGASKYLVGNSESSSNSSSNSNTSNNAGSSSTTSTTSNINADGQYSSIQGEISLWNDLENTIKSMLSDKGKVNVSQATTTVTVTDKPENITMVQHYLVNMNQSLSRQVALDIEVLEITLNKAFSYGVDWNLVRDFMEGRYNIAFNNASSGQVNNNVLVSPDTLLFHAGSGVWGGTNTFVNALQQQGKVSVATQPRVVTLNNQVAEIGINTQTTYLASVATTNTAQVGSTTALTPGQVTTGFTLYLLPKIQGNNIYLQISSTIANLLALQKISGNTSESSGSENVIYAPIVTAKRFNQRSLVPSGSTLVLAGFKQLSTQSNTVSVFGSQSLGGYGGVQNNIETIVLITPTLVNLKP